eukprot:maker-scaffold392_size185621-snap-gene-0.18 protein:Tk05911 transcript:maker-scaffold392_size185621-snap-gene-0.18-mRNA-1 annotation:"Tetraspanin-1"
MGLGRGLGTDMEGCGKCVKWSLFIVNFLIFVGGLVVLAVGIWTLADKAYIERLLRNELFISSAYILIIAGCIIVILSSLGCFGAMKEVKCMLLTYFIFLFLMFVVLLIGGVLGYVFRNQVEDNLRPEMKHTIEEYNPSKPDDPVTAAWDDTQRNLQCCGMGLTNMEDEPWMAWKMNSRVNPATTDGMVPVSCCRVDDFGSALNCTDDNPVILSKIYRADCFNKGLSFVKGHAMYLGGVAFGISFFMRRQLLSEARLQEQRECNEQSGSDIGSAWAHRISDCCWHDKWRPRLGFPVCLSEAADPVELALSRRRSAMGRPRVDPDWFEFSSSEP